MGLKTWLSLEPEKEVQSPGQNQLGVMEDKVQGSRLPTCNLRGYIDTKKSRWESTITQVLVRDGEKRIRYKQIVSLYQDPRAGLEQEELGSRAPRMLFPSAQAQRLQHPRGGRAEQKWNVSCN